MFNGIASLLSTRAVLLIVAASAGGAWALSESSPLRRASAIGRQDSSRPRQPSANRSHDSTKHGITCGPNDRSGIPDSAQGWVNWEVPEYQDRQRFVRAEDNRYGPVACVVARDRLDEVTVDAYSAPGGVLAGVAFIDADAAGASVYSNMKLHRRGYYCIVLRLSNQIPAIAGRGGPSASLRLLDASINEAVRSTIAQTPNATGWEAHIVPATDVNCGVTSDSTRIGGFRAHAPTLTSADYPAVARFVLDSAGVPGIGIRCGTAWCVLGLSASRLPPVVHAISGTGKARARRLIYGWYDDQRLALVRGAGMVPSIRATIVPHPGLDDYKIAIHFKNQWARVAMVRFSDTVPKKYRDAWGFKSNTDNLVELRHRFPFNALSWQVRINGVQMPRLKAKWTDHGTSAFLASTARWVWKDVDDGIWVRCDWGCCEVEPDGVPFEGP